MILEENGASDSSDPQEMDEGNPAMADAMRRVLSMGKNSSKKSIILAKAKVLNKKDPRPERPKDPGFEIEKGTNNDDSQEIKEELDDEDVKPDKELIKQKRIKKQEVAARGRVKPTALDREKERPLVKIATRGVVQLFNAVKEQQKYITKKLDEVGPSISKKEKVLKSIDRQTFLDVLRGCKEPSTKTEREGSPETTIKTEDEESEGEQGPSWSVLRDDFMMGAKLKDWDKQEDAEATSPPKPKKQRRNK